MLESLKTPWWRLPLVLTGVGIVLIVAALLVRVGWIPYLVGLVLLIYAAYRFARAEVTGGPRLLLAACAGGIVLIAGLVWLHPQSWLQPGWKLPASNAQLLGRSGGVVIFVDGDKYTARSTDGGHELWMHRYSRKVSIVGKHLLVQSANDPTKADAHLATTGKFDKVLPWKEVTTKSSDGLPSGVDALMPKLGSDEHVVAESSYGKDGARLVAAVDPTGHHYTRLDVVTGNRVSQYRVRDAKGLVFVQGVLVVKGSPTRVIPLIRAAPTTDG